MKDLIDRQAAIEKISETIWDIAVANDVKTTLKELASVQPELIRCKDCIYFTPEKSGEHWNVCRFYDAPKTADGYCNDAERKEE